MKKGFTYAAYCINLSELSDESLLTEIPQNFQQKSFIDNHFVYKNNKCI